MRFERFPSVCGWFVAVTVLFATSVVVFAQETTGGLQGTIKDPTGAVVSGAHVEVTAANLVGNKAQDADSAGYYRFANLPPGSYTITVSGKGFKTIKRGGVVLEVGHLPTVDITLEVGAAAEVVEVSGAAPIIDVTTETTQTNITQDVVQDVPHGRSFQSVIQFAPSARNEPLMGSTTTNGSGGNAPGSTTNGSDHGFSVGGASDAENSYLVEGQETANLIGGYSHTNVPFDFIQEVQIKSSGIEAEHGGALGGVVNVIMRKGSNAYHGSIFGQFENDTLDGSPNAYSRYVPSGAGSALLSPGAPGGATNGYIDASSQNYQPIRPHSSDVFPGFTFGGPILKDRMYFFVGFNPEWNNTERKIHYPACDPSGTPRPCGLAGVPDAGATLPFSRDQQTYYTSARVDAVVTQKVRVFGSWLYQYQRENGVNLPFSDSTTGFTNISWTTAPSVYPHNVGYVAPNVTTNFGADFTLTPRLVATARFGYYFENYGDRGLPTSGTLFGWQNSGNAGDAGAVTASNSGGCSPTNEAACAPLPTSLQQGSGHFNDANSGTFTRKNANKAIQVDADVAWFKSGWGGTHNFKFGYQLNRLQNDILQSYNEPYVQLFVGDSSPYSPLSTPGIANCAALPLNANWGCQGQYGTVTVFDFGTGGNVTSFNHGLFAQDAWTIGRGITINAGVRFDKEYLPASTTAGLSQNPINFSWGDKIAPRIGAAWDVFKDGKMKVFGSYGKFFDIMKLNVAISSFGGQYWNNCTYALDTANLSSIAPALNSTGRYCVGDQSTGANWAGGAVPAGLTFIENINNRTFPTTCSTCSLTSTGVTPGLKPYSQHQSTFGVDYQIRKTLALEARWDRTRLDTAIEDSSLINGGNETFVVGNPGLGIERNFNSFYNFLYPGSPQVCSGAACPGQGLYKAARSYDGVEFRLTKTSSQHWFGMFSYTYSKLRGNYTGLTSSDISDGQAGGRSSPNNSRAFDEPYFSYNAFGGSSSGLLPTDRPNTFKGYAYYELGWLKKFTTDFGIFQYAYSGSPITSYLDVGAGAGQWAVQAWDRGKYVDVTQDPTTGFVTVGAPRTQRTPWYTQTDFSLQQNYKVGESKMLTFTANAINLLNQRAVTAYNADMTSLAVQNQYITLPATTSPSQCTAQKTFFGTCYIGDNLPFYAAAEGPYNVQNQMNNFKGRGVSAALNSAYHTPIYYQLSRNIRLGVKFTF
jgi:Carboxypeptidase regulatory-like domain